MGLTVIKILELCLDPFHSEVSGSPDEVSRSLDITAHTKSHDMKAESHDGHMTHVQGRSKRTGWSGFGLTTFSSKPRPLQWSCPLRMRSSEGGESGTSKSHSSRTIYGKILAELTQLARLEVCTLCDYVHTKF